MQKLTKFNLPPLIFASSSRTASSVERSLFDESSIYGRSWIEMICAFAPLAERHGKKINANENLIRILIEFSIILFFAARSFAVKIPLIDLSPSVKFASPLFLVRSSVCHSNFITPEKRSYFTFISDKLQNFGAMWICLNPGVELRQQLRHFFFITDRDQQSEVFLLKNS